MIYVPLPFACMPKLSTYSILDKSEKNGKLYLNFLLLKRDYNKNGTHPSGMWGS